MLVFVLTLVFIIRVNDQYTITKSKGFMAQQNKKKDHEILNHDYLFNLLY